MPDVTVPTARALSRKSNVELIHTGTWAISTGEWTVTPDDLTNAVAALECPSVRRPVLKLGHTDPRFDGEPAVGWVDNVATAEDGRLLVGDYVGMPGWLGDVIASAYPDRSVEGQYDFRCQLGHTHPFVVTAVALLGVQAPGIGTLESLQDVAALYGVAAAVEPGSQHIAITLTGGAMSNPRAAEIAAGVTTEDVRRAFYASPVGDGWDVWIEEIQLEPLQLIAMNDSTGKRARVPVEIGAGDGEDAVSFGEAVDVVVRYDDVAATTGSKSVRYASREESRPGTAPADPPAGKKVTPPTTAAEAAARIHSASVKAGHTQKGTPVDFTTDQLAALRTTLGIPDGEELEPAKVLAAVEGLKVPQADPAPAPAGEPDAAAEKVAAAKPAPGTMTIDASAWDERETRIKRLEAAAAKHAREERDDVIASAVSEGKFPPARKEHWVRLWDADPEGTREVLAGLAKNVVPVDALGVADDGESSIDDEYASLFPPQTSKGA